MYKEGDQVYVKYGYPFSGAEELVQYVRTYESIPGSMMYELRRDESTQSFSINTQNATLRPYITESITGCKRHTPIYIGIGSGGYHVCKTCDVKITI